MPTLKPVRWIGSSREDLQEDTSEASRGGLPTVARNARRLTTLNADDIPVAEGSGNVFADLDLPNADELQFKVELTRQLYNRITALGLSQMQTARQLSLKQPDVSKLMHGRSGHLIA